MVGMILLASWRCAGAEPERPKRNEAVTVVILPPRKQTPALLLLCDRLAESLGETKSIRVVDRTQLDRILQERKTASQPVKPMLAYDLMVRVKIDLGSPRLVLELIDLSTGNVVGSRAFAGGAEPSREKLAEMTRFCIKSSRRVLADSKKDIVKVRLLGATNPVGLARLEPLRKQIAEVFEQVVERCPNAQPVRHLEAMTAKEESLLLLMGLSRLGGQRRFVPQADATLEAQLREIDAEGKTFEGTTVEIRFRLARGRAAAEKWTATRGKVADWQKVVAGACESVARQLGNSQPEALGEFAAEMVRRRRQAEAEFTAGMSNKNSDGKPDLKRIAAAAKIDPTYEPAAYHLILDEDAWEKEDGWKKAVRAALIYLERFPGDIKHRRHVLRVACREMMRRLPLWRKKKEAKNEPRRVAPPIGAHLHTVQKIVEIGLGGDIRQYPWYCGLAVPPVYRAMADAGVPLENRRRWLDWAMERVDVFNGQVDKVEVMGWNAYLSSFMTVRHCAVAFAVEEGDGDRAREMLKRFMEHPKAIAVIPRSTKIGPRTREAIVKLDDPKLLAKYDRWLKPLIAPVWEIRIKWKDPLIYADTKAAPCPEVGNLSAMTPLVIGGGRLYGVACRGGLGYKAMTGWRGTMPPGETLAYLPLDDEGRAAGGAMAFAAPKLQKDMAVTSGAFLDGKLYLGTKRTGLLAYEPKSRTWKQYGAEQGLPDLCVYSVHGLDEKTLLCVGGKLFERGLYYTLNVRTGQITLIRRIDRGPTGRAVFWTLDCIWRDGGRLMGTNYLGLAEDVLGKKPKFRKWPDVWPHGWRVRPNTMLSNPKGMVKIGSRRWVMDNVGLHEIEGGGKVLRSWCNRLSFSAGRRVHSNLCHDIIITPGDFPNQTERDGYHLLTQSRGHLFLIGRSGKVLCYDPKEDTWYGPLTIRRLAYTAYPLAGKHGVWIGGTKKLIYVETSAFIKAAQAAGMVMTSQQVRQRKRALANKLSPLEGAKYELLIHNFGKARDMLAQILKEQPDNPTALLLMGMIHDFWCLNRIDESLKYYRILAGMKQDPSAVYTGLFAQFRIYYTLGDWDRAIAAGQTLLTAVPRLAGGMSSEVERFMYYARKQRAKGKGGT